MLAWPLAIFVVALTQTRAALPPQSPFQREYVQKLLGVAREAHVSAAEAVKALLVHSETRRFVAGLDPNVANMLYSETADQALARFNDALNAAEIVHSWGDEDSGETSTLCVNAPTNTAITHRLGKLRSRCAIARLFERDLSKPMAAPRAGISFTDVRNPDYATASERPYYGALNMYRGSAGNPQCGPISIVLSRTYLANQALITPGDSGYYNIACTGKPGSPSRDFNCSAWNYTSLSLGVPPYTNHLIEPYLRFHNATHKKAGNSYPFYNLARLLVRLLSRTTYRASLDNFSDPRAVPLTFIENETGYLEVNPVLARLSLPASIHLVIASFDLLWRTPLAARLRAWCIAQGLPLAYAYNPGMSYRCGNLSDEECAKLLPRDLTEGFDVANLRVLDPVVLERVPVGWNVTISTKLVEQFEKIFWNGSSRRDGMAGYGVGNNKSEADAAWNQLRTVFAGTELGVEPVFARACSSVDCVAVVISDGTCICPQPEEGYQGNEI